MSKKQIIALADVLIKCNQTSYSQFTRFQLEALARFCEEQNPRFNKALCMDYIAGRCGKSGGSR